MPDLLILNHIFFLLQYKLLAKIIGQTINLCNFRLRKHSGNHLNVIIGYYKFNDFIVMFLIIRKIYLLLYRTHVTLWDFSINNVDLVDAGIPGHYYLVCSGSNTLGIPYSGSGEVLL